MRAQSPLVSYLETHLQSEAGNEENVADADDFSQT